MFFVQGKINPYLLVNQQLGKKQIPLKHWSTKSAKSVSKDNIDFKKQVAQDESSIIP